jgi:hypothetical protein
MNDIDAGYSITEQVFDRREMARIRETLAGAELRRTRARARHVLRVPAIHALATHPALVNLAAAFVGAQAIPFRATLFDKSAVSNWQVAWHQDTALPLHQRVDDSSWGPWSVKGGVLHACAPAAALATVVALRVHLDDSTLANGPAQGPPGHACPRGPDARRHSAVCRRRPSGGVRVPGRWGGRHAASCGACVLQSERSSASTGPAN